MYRDRYETYVHVHAHVIENPSFAAGGGARVSTTRGPGAGGPLTWRLGAPIGVATSLPQRVQSLGLHPKLDQLVCSMHRGERCHALLRREALPARIVQAPRIADVRGGRRPRLGARSPSPLQSYRLSQQWGQQDHACRLQGWWCALRRSYGASLGDRQRQTAFNAEGRLRLYESLFRARAGLVLWNG